MMSEAMFDLLYITDSVVGIALKFFGAVLIIKIIKNKQRCLKELER